jgi:hypothetical protein
MDGCTALSTGSCSAVQLRLGLMLRGHTALSGPIELAFSCDPLKRLGGALDTVLMLVAVGRQKFHDLIGAVRGHVAQGLRREIDRLTNPIFVCVQHSSALQHDIPRQTREPAFM